MSSSKFDTRPKRGNFPEWLHRKLPSGKELAGTTKNMREHMLHTVCEEAKCPNRLECFSKKTATFLACGNQCTRACGFCEIDFSKTPLPLDPEEPKRIAESSLALGLKHIVITMVARDDLPDKGANHIAAIILEIRNTIPGATVEVLTSDFSGDFDAVDIVLQASPEIFNYNTETVRELTPRVRHKATYERTLSILEHAKKSPFPGKTKSGLMLGLGETEAQVHETLNDLHAIGVDIVTLGQYLQPSKKKLRVKAFIHPDQFAAYKAYGESIGIPYVYAGPFVRSSYNAAEVLKSTTSNGTIPA